MSDDGLPLVSYVTPDPQFPLPSIDLAIVDGSNCDDDSQLERWRVSNDWCFDWAADDHWTGAI